MVKSLILSILYGVILAHLGFFPTMAKEKTSMGKSGYLIPRYVSLAKDTINVRTGPDGKYPILWKFKKAGLPIKVIAEYKDWRKIVDSEGASGWIWGPLLSSRRTALIIAEEQPLLEKPEINQPVSVIAEAGVIGKIQKCYEGWCKLDVKGFKGWLKQSQFWGALEGEEIK